MMYTFLFKLHSVLRYFVFLLLLVVIVKSLIGWLQGKAYSNTDNKCSLYLLIGTHTQLLVGLILYFVSPHVKFNNPDMDVSDPVAKHDQTYWTYEHIFIMLIAVALITIGRITHKKLTTDEQKFKRLFYLNAIALLIIIGAIIMSHRPLF